MDPHSSVPTAIENGEQYKIPAHTYTYTYIPRVIMYGAGNYLAQAFGSSGNLGKGSSLGMLVGSPGTYISTRLYSL